MFVWRLWDNSFIAPTITCYGVAIVRRVSWMWGQGAVDCPERGKPGDSRDLLGLVSRFIQRRFGMKA